MTSDFSHHSPASSNRSTALSRPETPDQAANDAQVPDMTTNWQQVLPALVAVLEAGKEAGRALARNELARMALTADLGNEALTALQRLHGSGHPLDEAAVRVLATACELQARQQARLQFGAGLADAIDRKFGLLAKQASGHEMPLEVCYSARGFYIGTRDKEGFPYSRESTEYWRLRDEACTALEHGRWTQRLNP